MAQDLDFAALSLDDAVPADLRAHAAIEARQQQDARSRALELKAQACDNGIGQDLKVSKGHPTTLTL